MAGLRQGLVLQWEKEFILQFHIYFYYSFAFISCARICMPPRKCRVDPHLPSFQLLVLLP